MPIMNYTTKVDVFATLGEIQGQLVKHGAKKIMQDYDNGGHITALSFLIDTPNGPRGVKLPANVDAVWNVLTKQKVKCDRDQAERVAWRIVQALRCCAEGECKDCQLYGKIACVETLCKYALDFIERLTAENAALRENVPQWISVEEGGKTDA